MVTMLGCTSRPADSASRKKRSFASVSDDQTVKIWDVASGDSRILSGHTGPVSAVAFSADEFLEQLDAGALCRPKCRDPQPRQACL